MPRLSLHPDGALTFYLDTSCLFRKCQHLAKASAHSPFIITKMTLQLLSSQGVQAIRIFNLIPTHFLHPTPTQFSSNPTLNEGSIYGTLGRDIYGKNNDLNFTLCFFAFICHTVRHIWRPHRLSPTQAVTIAPAGIPSAEKVWKDVWNTNVPMVEGPQPMARLGLASQEVQKSRTDMCTPRRTYPAIRLHWTQPCSTLYVSWIFSHRSVGEIPRKCYSLYHHPSVESHFWKCI